MKIDDFLMDKLEKYLMDGMNPQERDLFQKEINNSVDLQEFIEIYNQIDTFEDDTDWTLYDGEQKKLKQAASLFQNKDTVAFSQKLKDFKQDHTNSSPTKKFRWQNIAVYSSVAASIIFLFYSLLFQNSNLTTIYEQHNSWNELPSLSIKGETIGYQKAELEKLFLSKDYNATIKLGNTILASSKNTDPNVLLYIGISQIEVNKNNDALITFTSLIESNTIDNHKGYWYKAMVYLKLDDKSNAIKVLEKIVSKNYFKKDQALKILKKIK